VLEAPEPFDGAGPARFIRGSRPPAAELGTTGGPPSGQKSSLAQRILGQVEPHDGAPREEATPMESAVHLADR
jgi:hypothetical protein